MDARELRIGNWVLAWFGAIQSPYKVNGIDNGVVYFSEGYEFREANDIGSVEGIPLTEEWLLKFGFEEKTQQWNTTRWFRIKSTQNPFIYHFWMNDEMALYSSGDNYIAKCLFIHQLQNLYFCLTGEELTIKE